MLATIIQTCKFFNDCSIFSMQQAVFTHLAIVNSSCPSTVQTPANTEVIIAVMGWEHLISHNSMKIWSISTEIPNVHLVQQLDANYFSQKAQVPNCPPNTLYMYLWVTHNFIIPYITWQDKCRVTSASILDEGSPCGESVHKRKQYPFIFKGTGGKKQTLESNKCVRKIRKQQIWKIYNLPSGIQKLATHGKLLSYPCQNHLTYLCKVTKIVQDREHSCQSIHH